MKLKKKKVLFVGEHLTPSHLNRPLIVSKWLNQKYSNYEVHTASPSVPHWFDDNNNHHVLYSPTSSDLASRVKNVLLPLYKKKEIERMVESEINVIKEVRPDLVIHDFRNTLAISTQIKNIPLISINDFYWNSAFIDPGIIPDTPLSKIVGYNLARLLGKPIAPLIERLHVSQFNRVAVLNKLKKFKNLRDLYNFGIEQWLCDIPEVLPYVKKDDQNFIGPILWDSDTSLPSWMEYIEDSSAVCITLTSSGTKAEVEKIIKGLSDLNRPIIVLTAGKFSLQKKENLYVEDFVPLSKVLEKSCLLISTGGSSVVYQALKASVPVIGIPQNITHWLSMNRFAEMGIGKLLAPEEVGSKKLVQCTNELLNDIQYKNKIAPYQKQLEVYDPKKRVNELLSRKD